jgi:hypothetical protein
MGKSRALEEKQKNLEQRELNLGLEAVKNTLKKADQELYENLRLFVERIMLYRITRAEDKSAELGIIARTLLEVGTLSENPGVLLEEISSLESLAKEKLTQSEITNLFSNLSDTTENLDAKQLYYVLEKLRAEPIRSQ